MITVAASVAIAACVSIVNPRRIGYH